MMMIALFEVLTLSLQALSYFPWARKLSLAQNIMAPSMKQMPALMASFTLQVMKKIKSPPITSSTRKVPYMGRTYSMMLPLSRSLIMDPMLQKENTKKSTQMMMNRGLYLSISRISTSPSAMSSVISRKLITQIICPTKKEKAPTAKKTNPSDCNSSSISPSDPKASAIISDLMFLCACLTVNNSAIMIHTGMGLAQRSTMIFQWSESPIMQRMAKMTQKTSMMTYTQVLQKPESVVCCINLLQILKYLFRLQINFHKRFKNQLTHQTSYTKMTSSQERKIKCVETKILQENFEKQSRTMKRIF